MTRSVLTVRVGATVTHVHCKDTAAMWVTHLIAATFNQKHADVQGPIARHAPGDSASTHTVHGKGACGCTNELHDSSPNPRVGKVFTVERHHQSFDNADPGDNVGLNIKGLDTNNMPRSGDFTGYKKDTTLGQDKVGSSLEADLSHRLQTVEASLRLQASLGVGHLRRHSACRPALGLRCGLSGDGATRRCTPWPAQLWIRFGPPDHEPSQASMLA